MILSYTLKTSLRDVKHVKCSRHKKIKCNFKGNVIFKKALYFSQCPASLMLLYATIS